jgi:PAS domain S-box-containing protein
LEYKEELIKEINSLKDKITKLQSELSSCKRNEEIFGLALNSASADVWEMNIKTGTLKYGKRWDRRMGYSDGEVDETMKDIQSYVHPEDLERTINDLKAFIAGKKDIYETECRLRKKSGEYIWVVSRGTAIEYDEDGKPFRLAGVNIDITERKEKEAFIKERENEYKKLFKESERRSLLNRLLFNCSNTILDSKDFKTTARYIFDACREATGAKSGYVALLNEEGNENEVLFLEAGGIPCSVDPSLPMPIRGLREESYKTGRVVFENNFLESEWMKFIPEGHVPLKNVMFTPLTIKGKTAGIIGLANKPADFTEKDAFVAEAFGELAAIALKNSYMEEQLRKERDFANTVIKTARVIVLELDNKGNIVRINPFMEELTDYKEKEVKGKNWFKTFIPENIKRRIKNVHSKTISGKNTSGNINPIKLKNGTQREIIWFNSNIKDGNGNITGVLAVGQDITEQLKIEERLHQSEKMEAIGNLAGGIAHDFNNILGGIIGYSELSLINIKSENIIETNLKKILGAANRAKELVKQILTFTRQNIEEKKPVLLKPVVSEAITLLKASIPVSVKIYKEIRKETNPVLADSTKIHELILNIATNSVYAMDQKGTLFIHLYEENIKENLHGRLGNISPGIYTVLEITDTGCGMNQETLDRIFDPFYTTKPVGEGTGMGLSVVFGIIKSHNGNLTVSSTEGKGTTFLIYFPQTTKAIDTETEYETQLYKGTENILFVDDEEILADIGKEVLSSLGYNVTSITKSDEALTVFKKHPDKFDLLITDQTMPLITGIELSEEILKIKPDLPIILCTGYNSQADPDRVKSLGISKFFMKPVSWSELSKAIREILNVKER